MTIIEQYTELVKQVVEGVYPDYVSFVECEIPSSSLYGDITTNIALRISKGKGLDAQEVASELSEKIIKKVGESELKNTIERIAPIGGFINASYTRELLFTVLSKISEHYGNDSVENKKRITVEYGQPNTHKDPHVGHLFSYVVGDSISRLLEAVGHTIMRVNYQGDIGPNVAKCLYAWIQKGKPVPETVDERRKLMQECYQIGAKAYDADPIAQESINDLNSKIYQKDSAIIDDWLTTRQWGVDAYRIFEHDFGIQQTYHYWESEVAPIGIEIVNNNIGTIFKKSEGAIVYQGESEGLHTRVFITSKGNPTYETKEIGLNTQKYRDWAFDKAIITTASEQDEYFRVVTSAINKVAPELKDKLYHIGFGMISLTTGKMSSRSGVIVSAFDLFDETKERISEIMKDRLTTSEEKEDIIRKIAVAALRFAFLKTNCRLNTKFDLESSIALEGRSGPYIQYTYSRINSILMQEVTEKLPEVTAIPEATSKEELTILRLLTQYPATVRKAAEQLAPHIVADYVLLLAQQFNTMYSKHHVNNSENLEVKSFRRYFVGKVGLVLKHALNLLGIEIVERM